MPADGLRRSLGLRSVVLFGLAYMAPMIVLGTFGVVSDTTGGATPSAYLLALIAMLFTACSYGMMARAHPVAGSAYNYVRRTVDSRAGFLVGWVVLLDYFFLPMVIWLIGATYLQARFPAAPLWVWIVGFIVVTSALNVLGIKVADKTNYLLMAFQLLVVGLFVAFSLAHLFAQGGAGSWFSLDPFAHESTTWGGISAGAALAAYSFLGFDAVTTLTEETVEPRKTMPRAILLIALIGGGIFVAVAYTTQLVHPGSFADPDSAAFSVARTIAGNAFAAIFLAGLVVAQFASGLAAQASVSRLLFAMGRDSVLPKRVFGFVHRRFGTPVPGILLCGAVGLLALAMDVSSSTSFINFGAFVAFTAVNISVLARYARERAAGRSPAVLPHVLVPTVGALIDLWLLINLDAAALVLGVIWLGCGVAYLAYLTRLFRVPPPEMDMTEREDALSAA